MIEAGKLDRRIRVESATETRDSTSRELTRTWALVQEVWAGKLSEAGREMYRERQVMAQTEIGWRIRWSETAAAVTPDESYRIVDAAGRSYDITAIREEGRREALLVFGKARAE